MNLASSTYVRNVDAFSVIQKDIASGASKSVSLVDLILFDAWCCANLTNFSFSVSNRHDWIKPERSEQDLKPGKTDRKQKCI